MSKVTLYANDTPATPPAGKGILYMKSDGKAYSKGPDGVERALTSPGTFPANSILANFRNRLINGNFMINQRGVSITATPNNWTAGQYVFDRWWLITETGNIGARQLEDQDPAMVYSAHFTQPDVTSKRFGICQIIESVNLRHLKGRAFTLSGRIRCSQAQAIRYAVLYHNGTADTYSHTIVNSWTSTNFTANNFFTTASCLAGLVTNKITPVANTWTDFSLNGTLPADIKNAIVVIWTEAAMPQNNTLEIGKVQFEPDSTVSPFEDRFFNQELELCQRYYFSSFPRGTVPAMNVATNRINLMPGIWWANATYAFYNFNFAWPQQMRVSPTITSYTGHPSGSAQFAGGDGAGLNWAQFAANTTNVTGGTRGGNTDTTGLGSFHLVGDADI